MDKIELNKMSIEEIEKLILSRNDAINLREAMSVLKSKLRTKYVELANSKYSAKKAEPQKKKKRFWFK